ncbi:hypothetical protein ICW40_11665 [Actinotalea ferrariae]|uniref:hypothetical protein n=1 Tax=Actinotalea ferrariae TaxID=1386098 RepID=UPI001C8B762F|nr:hypothetical protein [Actinotalea ferrariae]MBX9245462.1 hypothetical protein [Actinotalea ferrariae]
MTTEELDQFGPWVLPVRGPSDVPRLYADERVDWDSVELALKVPRPLQRRDATPGMDLYDALLLVDAHALTVLRRRTHDAGYDRLQARHRDVLALESSTSMLDGRLTLHTLSGTVEVPYNGSQAGVIEDLLDVLRFHAFGVRTGEPRDAPALEREAAGREDLALVTAYRELVAAGVAADAVAVAPRGRVARRGGVLSRAADLLLPVTRHAAVVVVGPAEVHVLHRRAWLTTVRAPVHSLAHLVLPRDRRAALWGEPHARLEGVLVVRGEGVPTLALPDVGEAGGLLLSAVGSEGVRRP